MICIACFYGKTRAKFVYILYLYTMIYIANPIYDAVFKFMLEDTEVAKRFIGIIINKEITEIELKPQEKAYQAEKTGIIIQRLDFVAQIEEVNGEKSKVLIEIQKSNKTYHADVLRFRGYFSTTISE